MKHIIKLILPLFAFSAFAGDDIFQNKAKNESEREVIETMIQNDADSIQNLSEVIQKWFFEKGNESRVIHYDTPYEIPLDEVKNDGYLGTSAYLRKPGDLSGINERSAIWPPYTTKVMKVNEGGVTIFKFLVTLGEKSTPLPPAPLPNCYMYATYQLNGTTAGWNWKLLPDTAPVPMPVADQKCTDIPYSTHISRANAVVSNWGLYMPPGPQPNLSPNCSFVTSLPGTATPPPTFYEDVMHCVFRYNTPPTPTYCNGTLYLTMAANPSTPATYNLGQYSTDCSASSVTSFTGQSNIKIAQLGVTVEAGDPVCSIVNSHTVRCTATEETGGGVNPPPPPPLGAECEVYKYDEDGVLPATPDYYFTDRDCTGNWPGSSPVVSIAEHLQIAEHLANVFIDNTEIHSNKFCEFHMDNGSGGLGNQFDDEIYWNCDNGVKRLEFEGVYNAAHPGNEVACQEYTGALAPTDVKHKSICESSGIDVTLASGDLPWAQFTWAPYEQFPQIGGGAQLRIFGLTGNGGNHNGEIEAIIQEENDGHGGSIFYDYGPWITITSGESFAELMAAGYSYSFSSLVLSETFKNKSTTELTCEINRGDMNLNNSDFLEFVLGVYDPYPSVNNGDNGHCIWQGTISEYMNGTPTGKSSDVRIILKFDLTWR